jgi:hypothetical protein
MRTTQYTVTPKDVQAHAAHLEPLALSPDALFFRSRLASRKALHPANPWFGHSADPAPPFSRIFHPALP